MKSIEQLKQKHALALEAKRWEYRKKELQFLEAGQHQRALNQLMWQVPGMAIAITGGLWYGATTIDAASPRIWVFVFTAVVDLLTILTLWRIRSLIEVHIKHQDSFAPATVAKSKWPRYTVITCWTGALLSAAVVSGGAALHPEVLSKSKPQEKPGTSCNLSIDLTRQRSETSPVKPRAFLRKKPACHQ